MPDTPVYGNITVGSIQESMDRLRTTMDRAALGPSSFSSQGWTVTASVPPEAYSEDDDEDNDEDSVTFPLGSWDAPDVDRPVALPVFNPGASEIPYQSVRTNHVDRPTFEDQFMRGAVIVSTENFSHTIDFSASMAQYLPHISEVPRMIRTARDWINREYPDMTDNSLGTTCRHIKFRFDHGQRGTNNDGSIYYRFTISCRGCGIYWNTNEPVSRANPRYVVEVERQRLRSIERDEHLRQINEAERVARDGMIDRLRVRETPLWNPVSAEVTTLTDSYIRTATAPPVREHLETYNDYISRMYREREAAVARANANASPSDPIWT